MGWYNKSGYIMQQHFDDLDDEIYEDAPEVDDLNDDWKRLCFNAWIKAREDAKELFLLMNIGNNDY